MPGTKDQVVVALKSVEDEELHTQDTFLMVFTLDGEILLQETEVRVFCVCVCVLREGRRGNVLWLSEKRHCG